MKHTITIPDTVIVEMTQAQVREVEREVIERNSPWPTYRVDTPAFDGLTLTTNDDEVAGLLTATAMGGYDGYLKHKQMIDG